MPAHKLPNKPAVFKNRLSKGLTLNLAKNVKKGFTLIELVIGISVLSVVLLVMTGALFPQAERSTDPWFQVRSAELAQSIMNEILARRFDENSFLIGNLRCGETGAGACATQVALDACTTTEETSRDLYDDIDDFNCFSATGDGITNIENTALIGVYKGFTVGVEIDYIGSAKLIKVTVTPPRGVPIVYSSIRANY